MDLAEALVGRRIVATTYDKTNGDLYVETDVGKYRLTPYGDCCANCFIQHLSGSDALAPGAVVASVEDIESRSVKNEDCDVIDEWGHRVTTDKGVCSIEMRVEHNGYYGGSLDIERFAGDTLPGEALDDF